MSRLLLQILILWLGLWTGNLYAGDGRLYILHTNNTNGALENCYCPDHPLGALEKRAAFVQTWLQDHPNTIVVDAGDFLSITEREFKDSLVCEAYQLIPYDAVLLGDQELSRPPAFLNKILPRIKAPLLGTNLAAPPVPFLRRSVSLERAGLRIAILGVVGPAAYKYYPEEVRKQVQMDPPAEAIARELAELNPAPDLVIVLTHQGLDHDIKLAANTGSVHVIAGAHSQTALESALTIEGVLVAQAGKEGYYVGIVEVEVGPERQVTARSGRLQPLTLDMPDHPQVMDLIRLYEQKTGSVNRLKLDYRD